MNGSSHPTVATISLHTGPKPRNVVTFNADAYNLDAWDADTMGLFALPTVSGVAPSAMKKEDMSLSADPHLMSWSTTRAQEMDDYCLSSFCVLSAYFDQSRSKTAAGDDEPLTITTSEQFQNIASIRNLSPVANGVGCDGGGGLLSVDCHHKESSSPALQITSPLDEGMVSFYHSSPTSPATATNNDASSADRHHHSLRLEYLFDISEVHMASSATSILLGQQGEKSTSSPMRTITKTSWKGASSSSSATTKLSGAPGASFSDIISKFVTLNTIVHQATSYTDQLAKSTTSGSGCQGGKRGDSHVRWETRNVDQQHQHKKD